MTALAPGGSATDQPRHGGAAADRPMPTAPMVPGVRTRRRPGLVALGVALVATGALLSAWLVGQAGDRTPVLVLARDVPYGATLTRADLATTDVAVDAAVGTVPVDGLDDVLGSTAVVPLLAGSLLSRDAVGSASAPGPGEVVVGLAVPATRMPAGQVVSGDRVEVVSTPPRDADAPDVPPPSIGARVVRLGEPDLDGVRVVDVVVSPSDGPVLAAWSATGRIALVLQPASG